MAAVRASPCELNSSSRSKVLPLSLRRSLEVATESEQAVRGADGVFLLATVSLVKHFLLLVHEHIVRVDRITPIGFEFLLGLLVSPVVF
jgi:hypothetical protein